MWEAILFGLAVFFVVAMITAIGIICVYRKKLRSAIYPLDAYTKLQLNHKVDLFTGTTVTKVKIERDPPDRK